MNWTKVEDKVPPFEKMVLLCGKVGDKWGADVGSLQSIDKDGYNWDFNVRGSFDDLFLLGKKVPIQKFKPTHWCEIIPPQE